MKRTKTWLVGPGHQLDSVASDNFGTFVHIADPEGNRIELWETNDVEFEKMNGRKRAY